MAPIPSSQRKHSSPRNRGPGRPRVRAGNATSRNANLADNGDPPPKKRRYIPGGPGGGGRYVDVDGNETPVGGTGPGGYAYVGPRGPVGRENAANGVSPVVYSRPRRERVVARPRYSSAAAAAAAVVQGDGYKPREERGWEEFHQDLDIDARFMVFSAEEVDGIMCNAESPNVDDQSPKHDDTILITSTNHLNGLINGDGQLQSPTRDLNIKDGQTTTKEGDGLGLQNGTGVTLTPQKRRPGRPPRRADSLLRGIGTPTGPRMVPLPGPNPREKLTLPKPSFRRADTFSSYELKATGQQNYVDRTMASVGYQESDIFLRPDRMLIRVAEGSGEEDLDLGTGSHGDVEANTALGGVGVGRVEYDMDEQDQKWLEAYNAHRKTEQVDPIKPAIFEITMTKIEKEWHALEKRIPKPNPKPPQTHRPRSSSAAAVNGEPPGAGEEQDSKCAICDDGDCENTNAIIFCDGCDLAVHQECYGVPFIPEGQWLCRKCQLIGRGTPTCIFCPNTDGAFKQTNASRWSHLLCAIWIPEVTLGNTTFMEPVMDVEKVPKQRWKLTCYICRQKMGACIQCGNKNCFIAFHVTCARRARLFLKMKSTHGGPANLDASVLKAYCDKHVPSEWRRENEVDAATADAQDFYHHTMRGRLWADSQQSALALVSSQAASAAEVVGDDDTQTVVSRINLTLGGHKRKRQPTPKTIWKLSSGAPVIPQTVFNSVESSLQRFGIRKRKEYAAEACKYWTLKREARRGAALLKRLQLQMETFSSMEITRRNFAGMGAAGRVRLQRRVQFAEKLKEDVDKLRLLCDDTKTREREKLKDAEMLKDVVDTIYFPITPLLWPIMEKVHNLDSKGVFREGFSELRSKLGMRFYTSVSAFSGDLSSVFSSALELPPVGMNRDPDERASYDAVKSEATAEQKEKKKFARRIVKAIQGLLEEAVRKEAELGGKPFEKELKELDNLLDNSILSRRGSITGSLGDDGSEEEVDECKTSIKNLEERVVVTNGKRHENKATLIAHEPPRKDAPAADVPGENDHDTYVPKQANHSGGDDPVGRAEHGAQSSTDHGNVAKAAHTSHVPPKGGRADADQITNKDRIESNKMNGSAPHPIILHAEPPTPPMSSEGDLLAPLSHGGIPWYMEPFDPIGTTVHEERWTGREVVRGMSEELSELDDEELRELVDEEMGPESISINNLEPASASTAAAPRRSRAKKGRAARRWR
ncbi:MAG: nuA3 HAT complex component nto1 [Pycnora praestabilis]|nr:MAG: nuA3 HAT complex component nto1 [Pycnora praestabilis]